MDVDRSGAATRSSPRSSLPAGRTSALQPSRPRTVSEQLAEGHPGTRCASPPIDDVDRHLAGPEDWEAPEVRERYTDFTPIQDHLSPESPLKNRAEPEDCV